MVGAFNGNGTNNGANDNDQFMYAGRVSATAWTDGTRKLAVGVNGYSSYDNGTFTGRRTGWGVDTQFTAGRAELDAEYLHVLSNRLVGANIVGAGWSVQGSYFLKPKLLQAVARYETLDTDTALPTTTTESWVFGLNYLIKGDDLKLSLNYLLGDPAGPLAHEGRVIARLQVVF